MAAGITGLVTWWRFRDWRWGAGGLLMLANWPWTLLVIAPTNTALLAITPEAAGLESRALIAYWGLIHGGRTAISLAAVGMYLAALSRTDATRKS